ncbi:MAG TPA: excinuclease ABC subunit UvrC [Gammaproteobacteria bacterium]|nr:excinuclease ABC subunit UvrC [Gammaproteobacteria bacterium]
MFDHKARLKTIPARPGVYRMLNEAGETIYVGKARNLKNRVASYFSSRDASPKTRAMVAHIAAIEVTVTHTENEALLLENNLIKSLRPRYNVLLRDDKSYPYIYCSTDQAFPRLGFHRGARRQPGRYFGPYPSTSAVRDTLNQMQKLFQVRQCEDSFYRNRSRPCLQYQIKRCSAPCVGRIDADAYGKAVRHAIMFLEGRNSQVIDELVARMDEAAQRLEYEAAGQYRDQIMHLRKVQEKQYITSDRGDHDVIACQVRDGVGIVEVFFIRGGRNLGNRSFFPRHPPGADETAILSAFIPQYYLGQEQIPGIIASHMPEGRELLEETLSRQCGRRVAIHARVRGERARWMEMALTNAAHNLTRRLSSKANMQQRLEVLQTELGLDELPRRLECFDISHTAGESTVASCVVFDQEGPLKSAYRRFNITDITAGDDYAAMRQALMRRYLKIKKGDGVLPDLLFIDGGKGQLRQAGDVMEDLQIEGVTLVGIAKGEGRKPGLEKLHLGGRDEAIMLPADSLALHLIQHIRDEAHRFAISGHRNRRNKAQQASVLDRIPGIGPRRKKKLLDQFGGLQGVSRAGIDDLANLSGINKELARRIYDIFHENN